jgi:hypothetical protein
VVLLGMVPAWRFPGWSWVSLALASPVAVWGAWPFHRAALAGARHGAATMDTLISVGVTAAYLWSLYALASGGEGETYLEVAAGVTALVLLGPPAGGTGQAAFGRGAAGHCCRWAPRTSRCGVTAPSSASRRPS